MSRCSNKRCGKCEYRTSVSCGSQNWGCWYFMITGLRRGCPAGDACTKFKPHTGRYDRSEDFVGKQIFRTLSDDAALRRLYDAGLNDQQIASEANISSTTVWKWRQKNNLPANVKPGTAETTDYAKIEELYFKGMKDTEIAQAVGCSRRTVGHWRHRMGYAPNRSSKEAGK